VVIKLVYYDIFDVVQEDCDDLGGYLAEFESNEEEQALYNVFESIGMYSILS